MDRVIRNGAELTEGVQRALIESAGQRLDAERLAGASCFFCEETLDEIKARDGDLCRMGVRNPDKSVIVCDECAMGLMIAIIQGLDHVGKNFVLARLIEETDAFRITKPYPTFEDNLASRPSVTDTIVKSARISRETREKDEQLRGMVSDIVREVATAMQARHA